MAGRPVPASTRLRRSTDPPLDLTDLDDLVDRHADLFHKAAWHWQRTAPRSTLYDHDDLVQEAMVVMLLALRSYVPARAKLSTYLTVAVHRRFAWLLKREQRRDTMLDRTVEVDEHGTQDGFEQGETVQPYRAWDGRRTFAAPAGPWYPRSSQEDERLPLLAWCRAYAAALARATWTKEGLRGRRA